MSASLLLLLFAHLAGTGELPTKRGLVFFAANWTMFPAHFLQTTPWLMIGGGLAWMLLAVTAALASWRSRFHLRAWWVFYTVVLAVVLVAFLQVLDAKEDEGPREVAVATERVSKSFEGLAVKQVYAPVTTAEPMNVIVILAESLRYDLLESYADAAPFLNRLAKEGIVLERAYASASHSDLSDLAFWYSQYPYRGRGYESYSMFDAWRGTSMFEAFKASGYLTGYISSQNENWGGMINWLKRPGVDYFFHSEDFKGSTWENPDDEAGLVAMIKSKLATAGKVEDSQTLDIAAGWLEEAKGEGQPVMLGMNLQNTHYSYVMPQGVRGPYQPSDLGFKAVYYTWSQSEKENVRNRYLNAVYGLDLIIERFSKRLNESGLWDESLVVIVGDNGEGFYEHGFGNHSGPLYDESTRTLAIIKPPKKLGLAGVRRTTPVSHLDIAAEVLGIAGVAVPGSFQGVALEQVGARPVFMYTNAFVRQFGVVRWPWKLLLTEQPNKSIELYNMELDPAERVNRAADHPDVLKELTEQHRFWRESQFRYHRDAIYESRFPPRYLD